MILKFSKTVNPRHHFDDGGYAFLSSNIYFGSMENRVGSSINQADR